MLPPGLCSLKIGNRISISLFSKRKKAIVSVNTMLPYFLFLWQNHFSLYWSLIIDDFPLLLQPNAWELNTCPTTQNTNTDQDASPSHFSRLRIQNTPAIQWFSLHHSLHHHSQHPQSPHLYQQLTPSLSRRWEQLSCPAHYTLTWLSWHQESARHQSSHYPPHSIILCTLVDSIWQLLICHHIKTCIGSTFSWKRANYIDHSPE